jgi:hypothetical protein
VPPGPFYPTGSLGTCPGPPVSRGPPSSTWMITFSGGHTGRAGRAAPEGPGRAAPEGPRALGAPKEVVLKNLGQYKCY